MNILFLTAELTNSATGYCAKTVADALAKKGHYVHVVSANRGDSESVECEGHLVIHEVPGNRFRVFWRDGLNSRNKIKRLICVFLSLVHKLLVQVKGLFTILPLSHDARILFKNASKIIESETIQCVIPVVNPRESVIVANRLYVKYNVPYIPYYLDSIYGNIGLRFLPKETYKRRALKYEDRWVSDAKGIIMMQSVKGIYEAINPEHHPYMSKISYLDIPLLTSQPNKIKDGSCLSLYDGQFVILFIGTMPNRVRDPRYVFQLADALAKDDVHFYFAGKSDYMSDLNALIERNKNVHFLGQIEHGEIPNYVVGADVLLNIGNSISGMLPSKVFEYMSYQKPILSTIKHSSDLSVPYLKRYGAVHIVDETRSLQVSVDSTWHFIQHVKSDKFEITISELVKQGGVLYSNTPKCFCEKVEMIMS